MRYFVEIKRIRLGRVLSHAGFRKYSGNARGSSEFRKQTPSIAKGKLQILALNLLEISELRGGSDVLLRFYR